MNTYVAESKPAFHTFCLFPSFRSDMVKGDLGKRIKLARQKAGLTQKQLAERLGLTRPTVSQWE